MEDKTLLEEIIERGPDERMHKRKMNRAYKLMSMGYRDEADAMFDEILAEEPFNHDALTGKKLIERQIAVENRLGNLTSRVKNAPPAVKAPSKSKESHSESEKEEKSEARQTADDVSPSQPERRKDGFKLLRSKKFRTALIAAFALFLATAAAFVVTDCFDSDGSAEAPSAYVSESNV